MLWGPCGRAPALGDRPSILVVGARGIGGSEGGVEKFAEEFVRRVARDCRVTVLCLAARKPDDVDEVELIVTPRSNFMSTALRGIIRNGLLLISLVGIYFANYRTTMIAIAPMAMAQFTAGISGRFIRDQRAIVAAAAFVIALAGVIGVSWFLQQRFQDVTTVAESRGLMIKPPAEFSVAEGKTLSGRSYIWSSYLYAYLRGSDVQHVIGFGPETRALTKYAHNTLISYLYEYGVVGVILIIYWWAAMFVAGLRIVLGPKVRLLVAHVSFILLNMGTMPLWMIEGNILYGILCGYTLYLLKKGQSLGQIPSGRRAITLKQSSAKNSGVAARVQREIQQVVDQVGGSGSG